MEKLKNIDNFMNNSSEQLIDEAEKKFAKHFSRYTKVGSLEKELSTRDYKILAFLSSELRSMREKTIGEIKNALAIELTEYPNKMWTLNDGKMPFVIWEGKADEVEKFHIWRTGFIDATNLVKRYILALTKENE